MRKLFLFVLLLGCAACSPDYPMDKQGTWSLGNTGGSANDANLRAMVASSHDLIEGTGEPSSLSAEAAPPVKQLLTGKRAPLPASDAVQLQGISDAAPVAQ